MKYIIIALVVVFIFWIISLLIQRSDKKAKEKLIKKKQLEKQAKEDKDNTPFVR